MLLTAPEGGDRVAWMALGVALTSLVWSLVLFWLSGARLQVRLIPAVLTAEGHLMRGPDKGWRIRPPESLALRIDDIYVDLAIIKVTNIGRAAVSVSDINLDFSLSGWRPWWRHTIGAKPVPVHECQEIKGDVRLESGQSISVAIDHQPLIEHGRAHAPAWSRSIRASAMAAGRRPKRSKWRRRWPLLAPDRIYYSAETTPEREAFVEVFRAVYPRDVTKLYEAWVAVTSLLLSDSAADATAIAEELAGVLGVDVTAGIDLFVHAFKIATLLPDEVAIRGKKHRRGSWGVAESDERD